MRSVSTLRSFVVCLVLMLTAGHAHGQTEADGTTGDTPEESAAAPDAEGEPAGQETVNAVSTDPAQPPASPMEQLRSPVDTDRYNAALALGKAGDKSATLVLMELLTSDKNASVRGAAAWSLGVLAAKVAIPNLRHAAERDASAKVRMAASKALLSMGVAPERRVQQTQVVLQTPQYQQYQQYQPAVDPLQAYYDDAEYLSGRRMRAAGMVLFIVGGTLGPIFSGIFLSSYVNAEKKKSSCTSSSYYSSCTSSSGGSPASLALGVAGWFAGIPLWAAGQHKVNTAWNRFESASLMPEVNLAISAEYNGLNLNWRF